MANPEKKPIILGITGTIGSGKSTVGKILKRFSIPVIDTDHLVHQLLQEDLAVIGAIKDRFSDAVITLTYGIPSVNREKLGKIIFDDPTARASLEAIVHPATILACRKKIQENSNQAIVAVLVPLLFEANLESEYDQIWTIFTEEKILEERLSQRDNLSFEDIQKRLGAQMTQAEKIKRANHVINNSGTPQETENQIKTLLRKLNSVSYMKP